MATHRSRARWLKSGALFAGLLAIGSLAALRADEPGPPAKPEPAKPERAKPERTAAAPHRAVVTNELGEPVERFKPAKPETAEQKAHKDSLAYFMSGRLKQSESRFTEALADYQMAIKLDPKAVEVYRALVPLAFALNETEKGLEYAQKAIELDPQDLDILRILAEQLREQQKLDKAAEYLGRAAASPKLKKDSSTYVMLQLQLASLYMEMIRQDKSEPASRQVKEKLERSLLGKAADAYVVVFDARRNPGKYNLDFQTRAALERERLARYEMMGEIFLVADRTDQAIEAFEEAIKGKDSRPSALTFSLAQAYFRAKKYDQAQKSLQAYLDAQLQGKGRQPYELLGQILKATGKSSELLARIEDLAKADSRNATLQYYLADQYVAAGRLKQAEELIKRVLKESGDQEGYVGLAVIYHKEKKPAELLDAMSKGLRGQRGTDRLDHLLQEIQGEKTLIDGLIAAARKLKGGVTDKPKLDFFGAYIVGRLAGRAQKMDAAVEFYTQAMGARRELQAELADEVAQELVMAKRYAQAIDILKKALGEPLFPSGAAGERVKMELYALLSRAQELAGKTQDALSSIHEAQKLDSEEPELYQWEAWVYSHSHQWDEAIRRYEELLKKFAAHKKFIRRCQFQLSNCYAQKGDTAMGERILESVLAQEPDDPSVNNDLGYLYAEQGKHLARAETMIRIALKAEPDNVAYLDSMGWVLYKLGRTQEARTFLEKAAASPGATDATIWEHLADCLDRLNEHAKAVDAWKKALDDARGEPFPDTKLVERLKGKLKDAGVAPIKK